MNEYATIRYTPASANHTGSDPTNSVACFVGEFSAPKPSTKLTTMSAAMARKRAGSNPVRPMNQLSVRRLHASAVRITSAATKLPTTPAISTMAVDL